MKLSEMCKIQEGLIALLPKPTEDQLSIALIAEIGELVQELKADWCWWKRNDLQYQPPNREDVLGELVDVLHFLLSKFVFGIDYRNDRDNYRAYFDLYYDLRWVGSKQSINDANQWGSIRRLSQQINSDHAIIDFPDICKSLSFTREQVEEAYLKKVEINRRRWEVIPQGGAEVIEQ